MVRTLKPFTYFEPETIEEAARILSIHGPKAKVLSGGIDLIPRMRQRKIQPEYVVSIQRIPKLAYIEGSSSEGLQIGALTTLRSLEISAVFQQDYMALYEAVHQIASVQVKNMGTAVGNICVATPASDVAVALYALGAELRITGTTGDKIVAIEDFYRGVSRNILQPDEIVREVVLPRLTRGTSSAFLNLVRTAADIAKVSVAVAIGVTEGRCREVRIALGAVAPTVIRAKEAEENLKGKKLDSNVIKAAAETAAREARPITDIRSTAKYRHEMIRVLVNRTIQKALDRVKE